MANAQRKNVVTITLTGGPNGSASRAWAKDSQVVLDQMKNLLEYLGFNGTSTVVGLRSQKGSSHNQDLRANRPDTSGPLPGILFTAQPGGNDTCWVYRLNLPKDENPQILFARVQVALEEGRHMATVETAEVEETNVVPLRPSVAETQPPEPTDIGEVLADQVLMDMILIEVYRTVEYLSKDTPGVTQPIPRSRALIIIMEQLGPKFDRRAAGSVIEAYIHRKLLRRQSGGSDMLHFTKDGERQARSGNVDPKTSEMPPVVSQKSVDLPAVTAPVLQAEHAAPVQHAQVTQAVSIDDQIAILKARAKVYKEAQTHHAAAEAVVQKIAAEMDDLQHRLDGKSAELKVAQGNVSKYMIALANPEFRRAFEELERIRRQLAD